MASDKQLTVKAGHRVTHSSLSCLVACDAQATSGALAAAATSQRRRRAKTPDSEDIGSGMDYSDIDDQLSDEGEELPSHPSQLGSQLEVGWQ